MCFFLFPSTLFLRFFHVVIAAIFHLCVGLIFFCVNVPIYHYLIHSPVSAQSCLQFCLALTIVLRPMRKSFTGMEQLVHGVCEYLALQDNPSMFHKVIVPFTCLLEYSVHLILLDFLVFANFKNVQCYFIVVLICISLTINEDEHPLMYFLAIYVFSFVRCLIHILCLFLLACLLGSGHTKFLLLLP